MFLVRSHRAYVLYFPGIHKRFNMVQSQAVILRSISRLLYDHIPTLANRANHTQLSILVQYCDDNEEMYEQIGAIEGADGDTFVSGLAPARRIDKYTLPYSLLESPAPR